MPVDFSPLYAPVPESPSSRGLTSIGTALDAVLARKQHQDLIEQQIAERKQYREMYDATRRYGIDTTAETARANAAEKKAEFAARQIERRRAQDARILALAPQFYTMALNARKEGASDDDIEQALAGWEKAQGLLSPQPGQAPPSTSPQSPAATSAAPSVPRAAPPPQNPPAAVANQPPAAAPPAAPAPSPAPPAAPPPIPAQGRVTAPTAPLQPDLVSQGFVDTLPLSSGVDRSAVMQDAGLIPPPVSAPAAVGTPATARARSFMSGLDNKAIATDWARRLRATPEVQQDPVLARAVDAIEAQAMAIPGKGIKDTELMRQYLEQKKIISGEKKAAMAAAAAAKRAGAVDSNKDQTEGRQEMAQYLTLKGYKLDQQSVRQFQRMLDQAELAKRGNSKAAAVFMGMFVKFAQGEVGVLTPGDIETFWTTAGSPKERTEAALAKALNGGLGEGARKKAVEAVEWLQKTANNRLDDIYAGAVALQRKYGEEGDRRLQAYFGRGLPEMEAKRKAGLDDAERARMKASLGGGK